MHTFKYLLKKEPIPRDLTVWLVDVEPMWSKLGEHLGVSSAKRKGLERLHVSDGERLSKVLDMWKRGITSDYITKNLCECLTHVDKDTVKKIQEELQKREVAARYPKQPDYKP